MLRLKQQKKSVHSKDGVVRSFAFMYRNIANSNRRIML